MSNYLLFFVFVSYIGEGRPLKATLLEQSKICQRKYFQETYAEKRAYINEKLLSRECSNSKSFQCGEILREEKNSLKVTYGVTQDGVHAFILYLENSFSGEFFHECWGLAFQVETVNATSTFYFMSQDMLPEVKVDAKPGFLYNLKLIYLPIGVSLALNLTAPANECENTALGRIKRIVQGLTWCVSPPELFTLFKMAKKVCQNGESVNEDALQNINDTWHKHCDNLKSQSLLLNQNNNVSDTKILKVTQKKIPISLLVFASLVAPLAICLAVVLYIKVLRKPHTRRTHSFCTPLMHETSETKEGPISVMILNRPGCEILDSLMVSLSCVLKSHGIDVKLALLEQSQIDAEGGISSYLQRNIDDSQYILIACSDTKSGCPVQIQKPYEFAIRVISGLAYHNNSCERYIPIYLQEYAQAVKHIPSFLNASVNTGFRLPSDIPKLLHCLIKPYASNKGRELKTEFFISEMNEIAKKYMEEEHSHCCKDTCPKGSIYPRSVSNLSSLWTSTINSRWSSVKSNLESQTSNTDLSKCRIHLI